MAYKEKDTKKWTAQWFETNAKGEKKKRRKRGFETKREALEYERQKKLNNSRSMDMKLSEFMEVYFEDKQNELKERTMKNKRYMMEQHIIPYFGNQMMSEITAGQIIYISFREWCMHTGSCNSVSVFFCGVFGNVDRHFYGYFLFTDNSSCFIIIRGFRVFFRCRNFMALRHVMFFTAVSLMSRLPSRFSARFLATVWNSFPSGFLHG